ncbi:MAG: ankyrin repeat domain-containing protein [Fibrobacter sp.]|nr:ankyrin repeat domain-containing protein [Fibrobacter sp.]
MTFLRLILLSALSIVALSYADENVLKDSRDGSVYRVVRTKGNEWFAENLRFKSKGSYCYDDASACKENGRLYTWEIASMACPEGWRLPTDEEWSSLLAASGGWEGLQKSGIQIPMAGDRRSDGVYHYLGESAFFWSATPARKKYYRYKFDRGNPGHDRSPMVEGPAYSVKCVAGSKPCTNPLMNAVRTGNVDKVNRLLDEGFSVNESCFTENQKEMTSLGESYEGYSYLGLAVDKGNEEMVRLLLERGADPNEIDVSGPSDEANSMLTRATLKGNRKILGALLDGGAKIGFCDLALSGGASPEVLKILIEKISVEEMNQCWFGQSLVDLFKETPELQRLLVIRGGKTGPQVCPAGSGEESFFVTNSRMCGD